MIVPPGRPANAPTTILIKDVTIAGSADGIVISGASVTGIFEVTSGVTATLIG